MAALPPEQKPSNRETSTKEAAEWDKAYVSMRMRWERLLARIKVTLESPPQPKKPPAPKDPPLPGLDF